MTAPIPEAQREASQPPAADPPAPEREAVPEPAETGATGNEQRESMLDALNELAEKVFASLDNINQQLAAMGGGQGDGTPTDKGPWTHRGRKRA